MEKDLNEAPQQEQHLVELRSVGLIKRYGARTVADNVSFHVRQGEIVGLLGPNGAGKTTSFYMTTGLIVPNGGHVYLDGKEITDYPVYKRARAGIGYLPQEASVFRKLSVEDNIMSVLEMTKLSHQEQLDKLESLIKEFRLSKVRKNKGDRLSGGERRRCEIARCLAIDPKFVMLDEPFAGVDPIAVEDIQHIVWRLKYRNIGILITDHNVQETLSITDRAYLLFEGKILFKGLPEEISANPIVRKNYLSDNFVYRRFQPSEEDIKAVEEIKQKEEKKEAEAKQADENKESKEKKSFWHWHFKKNKKKDEPKGDKEINDKQEEPEPNGQTPVEESAPTDSIQPSADDKPTEEAKE